MKKYQDIDSYIRGFPKETQIILEAVRTVIQKAAPEAEEAISYGIPTFKLNGNLVHFGGFKKHIGFFPTSSGVSAFKKELHGYKTAKGTIQFPLDTPMPLALIRKITKYRVSESLKKKARSPHRSRISKKVQKNSV